MRPSEYLESEGWKRAPFSDWRDPVTGKVYLFIEAIQIQDERDRASQQGVQSGEVPHCTCKAGTGGHASWCELEKYWATLRR